MTKLEFERSQMVTASLGLTLLLALLAVNGNDVHNRARAASSIPSMDQAKLIAWDGAAYDNLGYAVAISGNTVVIGTYAKDNFAGAAYVDVRSSGTWVQQAKLTASDGAENDYFGNAVAISGDTAIIGAYGKNNDTGGAYIFVRSGGRWLQQAELTASDSLIDDNFGFAVAVDGDTAVVGADAKQDGAGAAYVFVKHGGKWVQQAKLTASNGRSNDNFGYAVAISDDTILVGANAKNAYAGAAYVFVRAGGTWTQQAELTAKDGMTNDDFGSAVAISGNTAVIGAYAKSHYAGAAYVEVRRGRTWTQQAKLTAGNGLAHDYFGWSVAIDGNTAVIGAYGANKGAGATYVEVRDGTRWAEQAKLTARDGAPNADFGIAVAVSGTTVVVGEPNNNVFARDEAGAAYIAGVGD